jgi:hypothetical protein
MSWIRPAAPPPAALRMMSGRNVAAEASLEIETLLF